MRLWHLLGMLNTCMGSYFNEPISINFGLSPYIVCASSEASGETACMHRLV